MTPLDSARCSLGYARLNGDKTATVEVDALAALIDPMHAGAFTREPCGAQVVIEYVLGDEAIVRWCGRTFGACPYAGATPSKGSQRSCAAKAPVREAGERLAKMEAVIAARAGMWPWPASFGRMGTPDA